MRVVIHGTISTFQTDTGLLSRVTERPPTVYAVMSFSGWARGDEMQSKARELQAALEAHGIVIKLDKATGKPIWLQARYDSPWVPAEKRTNEVLMELVEAPPTANL